MAGCTPQGESGFGIQWANMSPVPDEPSSKRRKVKCLYDSPYETTCIPCRKRGSECVSQVDSDAPSESTEHNVHAVQSPATSGAPRTYAPLTPESRASPLPLAVPGGVQGALLRAIPSRHDILLLMKAVGPRLALDYRFCSPSTALGTDPRTAVAALLSPSSHPVLLARQMLQFAAALQSIPGSTVVLASSQSHLSVMRRMTETVIKEVNSNDNYLGSLEGLDNLISEALWHIDCGHLRRAWISLRRAVMVAQLLGVDRPGSPRYKVLEPKGNLDAASMYEYVVRIERVLSLLLGLPTSTNGLTLGLSVHDEGIPATLKTMTVGMSDIIVKVLSRNQLDATPQNMEMTRAIDRDLIMLAESMPSSYWRPLCFTGLEPTSTQAIEEMQRGYAHACFHSRTYSKIACASASRELLSKAIAMHSVYPSTARPGGRCLHDFLAAIAGLTLMLAHTTSHHTEDANLLRHQRATDRATVQRAVECIQSTRDEREEALALKCTTLLQDLLVVENEIAKEGSHHNPDVSTATTSGSILSLQVPYIGRVTISHKGVAIMPPALSEQHEESEEDVTIGGLGSIRASHPNTPGHQERENDCHAQVTSAWKPTCGAAPQDLASSIETDQQDSGVQAETMFPDAAAGLDDWTFQGLDTAFFDSLMRGSNDVLSNTNIEQSSWDTRTTWPGRQMGGAGALPDT
ncbi:hypothetical protein LTR95_009419 [Oleoguttula sp. CCFEE 5521]